MSKLSQNKQEKLNDAVGQLPDSFIEESREENLLTHGVQKAHPVLRWVLVAVVAVMIVGAMFAASVFGDIAWKRSHPENSSGIQPGAVNGAGYDAERGVWVLSKAWADYAKQVGDGAPSLEKVYAFAFQLRETGQPVEIERNFFVEFYVNCYRENVFQENTGNTLIVRPDTGFPLNGEEERETYLYFLAALTNCLGDHVYYSDYDYQVSSMNRYRSTMFSYSPQDFDGGFQNAAEEGNAQIQQDKLYMVNFTYPAIHLGVTEIKEIYAELRGSFVPDPVTASLQTPVGKNISSWFAEMVTNYRTAGELIIPLDIYEDYLGIPDFLENYPGEIFDHAPEINLTGEEMQKYSETYFAENSLIAVLTMEGSTKTKYTAAAARQDGKIQIIIDKTYPFKKVLWLTPKITLVEVEGKCGDTPIEIINGKNETEPDPCASETGAGPESSGTDRGLPFDGYRNLDVSAGVDVYFGAMAAHTYSCIVVARNDPRQMELTESFQVLGGAEASLADAVPRLTLKQVASVLEDYNLTPEKVSLRYMPIMVSSYIASPEAVKEDVISTFSAVYSDCLVFSESVFP